MLAPEVLLADCRRRITEIVWWNRNLTKLDDERYFANYAEFLAKELVQLRGPYIEFVKPAALLDEDFDAFAGRLKLHPEVVEAVKRGLFQGRPGRLFKHQAEAIEELTQGSRDVILSVPTATGKTEAFTIPILSWCCQSDVQGLKALLVYPLKTLEVDQLNRLIRLASIINENRSPQDQIVLAIWDGDTPDTVKVEPGEAEVTPGSPLRGIVCPLCNQKLVIRIDEALYCQSHGPFYWIKVTRSSIRASASKINLLITNPESVDFLLINKDEKIRQMLEGEGLRYIVFDEAHVWRGISGAHVRVLSRRLRRRARNKHMQMVAVSATIANPLEFGKIILDSSDLRVVEFTPASIEDPGPVDFSAVRACTFRELCETLLILASPRAETFSKDRPDLANALEMGRTLSLVSTKTKSDELTREGAILVKFLTVSGENPLDAVDEGILNLLSSLDFLEWWRTSLRKAMPQVFRLASLYTKENRPLSFEDAKSVRDRIRAETSRPIEDMEADRILATCLSFGRTANLLSDKYHVFLKPLQRIFWCKPDKLLQSIVVCRKCGGQNVELRFCPDCHLPFVLETKPEDEDVEEEEDTESEDDTTSSGIRITPITSVTSKNEIATGICPGCGASVKEEELVEPDVFYSTMASYLLSAFCRVATSPKTLVFSDGRRLAEQLGKRMQQLDYSLVGEQLYALALLREPGRKKPHIETMFWVMDRLKEYYVSPLLTSVEDEASKGLLIDLFEDNIKNFSYLSNCSHLIENSIIAPIDVYEELTSDTELAIAQALFAFYHLHGARFSYRGSAIPGYTVSRLLSRLSRRFRNLDPTTIRRVLRNVINALTRASVIAIASEAELNNILVEVPAEARKQVEDELERERQTLGDLLGSTPPTGLIVRPHYSKGSFEFTLGLIPQNSLCLNCYSVFPHKNGDLARCPLCGGEMQQGSRLDGQRGYVAANADKPFPIDHWGKDILGVALQAQQGGDLDHPSIFVHRAGIPMPIRGAIEEGFRKSKPIVNIVSSTPTLELGIDIGTLDAVLLLGLPPTLTNYVQRSGRAGRARGRPSFIFTIIRNNHSIDNHFFADLTRYFRELKPVRVPDPFLYPPTLAPHVVTEITALVASRLNKDEYDRLYAVNEVMDVANFGGQVLKHLNVLVKLVTQEDRYAKPARSLAADLCGSSSVFDEIFTSQNQSPLNLLDRAKETFSRLQKVKADQRTQMGFVSRNRTLGTWLAALGYIAPYRGISGGSIPLVLQDRVNPIELKSPDYIIREAYPGEKGGRGAVFYVETVKFMVERATGGPICLLREKQCTNEKCMLPYNVYSRELSHCPVCISELEDVSVYNIDEVTPRRTGPFLAFETSPISVTYATLDAERAKGKFSVGNQTLQMHFGRVKTVSFTPAYYRSSRRRGMGKLHPSRAEIRLGEEDQEQAEVDVDEFFKTGLKLPYHPFGYDSLTEGVEISVPRIDAIARLGEEREDLVRSVISLIQALRRAVMLSVDCEQSDFAITWTVDPSHVKLFILDSREGGTGIIRQVFDDMCQPASSISSSVVKTSDCPAKCLDFCEYCLLLERTPEYWVAKRLLNRHALRKLIGVV